MTDYDKYILACLLRPIVGGNPVLDGIIKEAIKAIGLPAEKPKTSASTEAAVEEAAIPGAGDVGAGTK
jgi:hypothetical protein